MAQILDPTGRPAVIGTIPPLTLPAYNHDPANPTYKDFKAFSHWRMTKCQPRDYDNPGQRIEDIDQATHEFIGEVAELADLVLVHGANLLDGDDLVIRLLDEAGDIFFCGSWLLDAWGVGILRDDRRPDPDAFLQGDATEASRGIQKLLVAGATEAERVEISVALSMVMLQASTYAGLLSNSFKKAVWQRRPQDPIIQARRIVGVFSLLAQVLAMAGLTVADALEKNVRKLDTRYPNGYVGPGGGNRTGEGK